MTNRDRNNDVVDLLKGQHIQIRRAFRRAARPGPGRRKAFHDLVRLLAVHETAEEAHVHPAARHTAGAGRAVTSARRAEEKRAKKLLAELWKIGPDGDGYRPALRTLRQAVLAHAAHEEREEFPALLQQVSPLRRRMLAAEVRITQAVAPTRPHPAVNNELANKLAAPVFGPLDRVRDLLMRATSSSS